MEVSRISSTTRTTSNGTLIVESGSETDKDLFLKMLVAQMTNQDPFNSQDPSQYITQLAQFNTLEQMMAINESMEYLVNLNNAMLVNNAVSDAAGLIGKNVEVLVANDSGEYEEISGEVKSASIKDGIVLLEIEISDTGELKEVEYSSLIKVN